MTDNDNCKSRTKIPITQTKINFKGDERMMMVRLKDIESAAKRNSEIFSATANRIISDIQKKNLRKGRVRPKDPIEAKILARFKRN